MRALRLFLAVAMIVAGLSSCGSDLSAPSSGLMPDGTTPWYDPALELREMDGFTVWQGTRFSALTSQWVALPQACSSVIDPSHNIGSISAIHMSVTPYSPGLNQIDVYPNQQVPYHGFNTFYAYAFHRHLSGSPVTYCYEDLNYHGSGPSFLFAENNLVTTDAGTNLASTHRWGNQHGTQKLWATLNLTDTLYITVP